MNLRKIAKKLKNKKEKPTIKEKLVMVGFIKKIVNEAIEEVISEKIEKLKEQLDEKKDDNKEKILEEIQSHESVFPHLGQNKVDEVHKELEKYQKKQDEVHQDNKESSKKEFKELIQKIKDANRDLKYQTIETFVKQKRDILKVLDRSKLALRISKKLKAHNLSDHKDIKEISGKLLDILVSGKMAVYPKGHPKQGEELHIHPQRGGGGGAAVAPAVAQNLWETITADVQQTTASNPNDILGIRGRDGVDTEIIGDDVFIDVDGTVMRRGGISTLFTVTADVQQTTVELGDDIGFRGRDGIDTEVIGDDVFFDLDQSVVRTGSSMFTVTADQGPDIEIEHDDTLGIFGGVGASTRNVGGDVYIDADAASAAGNDEEIQYNSNGIFSADPELLWDSDGIYHRMGINSVFTADYYRVNVDSDGTHIGIPVFIGTGTDDLTEGGNYTNYKTRDVRVEIDSLSGSINSITDNIITADVNSIAHGLGGGEVIEITNSAAWNGTYFVVGIVSPDIFTIAPGGLGNEGPGANWEINPNTFQWSKDGGVSWDATDVAITGAAQGLFDGITVTFGAILGHDFGDRWDFTVAADNLFLGRNEDGEPNFRVFWDGTIISDAGAYGAGPTLPDKGSGTKFIWYPRKAAFRAGHVTGSEWDDSSIGDYSAVVGGESGRTNAIHSAILGGYENTITNGGSGRSVILGGFQGLITNDDSAIVGGSNGIVKDADSVILGGRNNTINTSRSVILGGANNISNGGNVLGGDNNTVSNAGAVLGTYCEAGGLRSFVTSYYMKATGTDSYIFGVAPTDSVVTLAATNTFYIYNTNFIFNEGSHDRNFRIESNGDTYNFFSDGGADAISIGNSTAVSGGRNWKLLVKDADSVLGLEETTTNLGKIILGMKFSADSSILNTDRWISFNDSGGEVGWIDQEVVYNNFTGGHSGQTDEDFTKWKEGMILSVTGEILEKENEPSSMGRALSKVRLAKGQKDVAVIGIYTASREGKEQIGEVEEGKDKGHDTKGFDRNKEAISYNAVGEGKMLVCDTNGNIEIGDYICSSSTDGYGEKQDDNLLHNYTVAKATQSVDWSKETVKNKLIACTYHGG